MSQESTLTLMLKKLKAGDEEAANVLWLKCYPRLVQHARKHLEGVPRRMSDEEDIALSAIKSFCKAVEMDRFPSLNDSSDLWRLLFSITTRKSISLRRYEGRRPAKTDAILESPENTNRGLQNIPGDISEEEFANRISEELDHKLRLLNPKLREIAVAKLEGYQNKELSQRLEMGLRTVERNLDVIRQVWLKDR
ncbi:MAG: RNA polymerase subunit sigma-70 [Planctomycetaceae bacterium]|nr:RNA polymerase subunit sigma-70 [Planctomycetaceae bacterium]